MLPTNQSGTLIVFWNRLDETFQQHATSAQRNMRRIKNVFGYINILGLSLPLPCLWRKNTQRKCGVQGCQLFLFRAPLQHDKTKINVSLYHTHAYILDFGLLFSRVRSNLTGRVQLGRVSSSYSTSDYFDECWHDDQTRPVGLPSDWPVRHGFRAVSSHLDAQYQLLLNPKVWPVDLARGSAVQKQFRVPFSATQRYITWLYCVWIAAVMRTYIYIYMSVSDFILQKYIPKEYNSWVPVR